MNFGLKEAMEYAKNYLKKNWMKNLTKHIKNRKNKFYK